MVAVGQGAAQGQEDDEDGRGQQDVAEPGDTSECHRSRIGGDHLQYAADDQRPGGDEQSCAIKGSNQRNQLDCDRPNSRSKASTLKKTSMPSARKCVWPSDSVVGPVKPGCGSGCV